MVRKLTSAYVLKVEDSASEKEEDDKNVIATSD
jgi:hypothetical protein